MTTASFINHTISFQAIAVFGSGVIIVVVASMIMMLMRAPYMFIVVLVLNNVLLIIYQSLAVNCMVKGGCEMFAWLAMVLTILAMLLIFARLSGLTQRM